MEKFIEEQGCLQVFIVSFLFVFEGVVCAICDCFGVVSLEINIGIFDEYFMLGFFVNNVWLMQQDENVWVEKVFEMMLSVIEERLVKKIVKVGMKLIKCIRKK